MIKYNDGFSLLGRVLLSIVFVESGIDKIPHVAMLTHAISAHGLPGILAYGVIVLEVGGGIALALGFLTRFTASALAIFSVLAITLFLLPNPHKSWTLVWMEWAMVGGLLYCIANGAGHLSVDQLIMRMRGAAGLAQDGALAARTP